MFHVKQLIALVFIGLAAAVVSAFAQSPGARVLERSNDFAEIKAAFQKRLYDASSDFNYFFYQTEPFDVNGDDSEFLELLDRKARKAIEKNKYFIFEASVKDICFLLLVNKEDSTATAFSFFPSFPSWFEAARPCSRDAIDEALYFSFGE